MWWIWLTVFVVFGLYFSLIVGYYFGLKKIINEQRYDEDIVGKEENNFTFSVVIAARNEEANIKNILLDLVNQNYSKTSFEIVLIDDDSQDKTYDIAQDFLKNTQLNFHLLQSNGGKKKALSVALQHISNEIVIFTDADCRIGNKWLQSFNIAFNPKPRMMVSGPVIFSGNNSILSKLLSLEFASLVASGMGAIGIQRPVMVNGANLAVRKQAIERFGMQVYSSEEVSGDDVFMMSAIRKEMGASQIGVNASMDALVTTPPPHSLKAFINQRLRWTSKSRSYADKNIIYSAFMIFVYNFFLVVTLGMGIFYKPDFYFVSSALLFLKIITDIPLLWLFLRKYKLIKLRIWVLPLQIIYPFYIIIIGILGQFLPYTWKGRKRSD